MIANPTEVKAGELRQSAQQVTVEQRIRHTDHAAEQMTRKQHRPSAVRSSK